MPLQFVTQLVNGGRDLFGRVAAVLHKVAGYFGDRVPYALGIATSEPRGGRRLRKSGPWESPGAAKNMQTSEGDAITHGSPAGCKMLNEGARLG